MPILEIDGDRDGEPFMRLPAPLSHIRLTPPRESDDKASIAYLNDMRVAQNLHGPPFPYRREHYETFYSATAKQASEGYSQYQEALASNEGTPKWMDAMPVRSLRDTTCGNNELSDGGQLYIGDVELRKAKFAHMLDVEEREKAVETNASYPAGDKRIVWEFGDFTAPSHWGQGVMSAAIKVIMDFAVQYLNVHTIEICYFAENLASRRVFEKNGFVVVGLVPKAETMPEIKGGKVHDLGVMRWQKTN